MEKKLLLLAFLLLTSGVVYIALLAVTIQYVQAGSHLDTSSFDFALFKNTGYTTECGQYGDQVCPDAIMSRLREFGSSGLYWTDAVVSPVDYCRCFLSFKILPSTPRDSAFTFSWASLALDQTYAITSHLWAYFGLLRTGADIWAFKWPMFLGDIFITVAWWVNLFIAAAHPASKQTPSLLQWITPWKYLFIGFSRASKEKPHAGRITVTAAVFFVAQVVATIAIMARQHVVSDPGPSPIFQRYDLQASALDQAPGTANCSAEDIASLTGLFVVPQIVNSHQDITQAVLPATYLASFVFDFVAAVAGLIYYMVSDSEEGLNHSYVFMMVAMAIMEYWILLTPALEKTRSQPVILFHPECNVVHVTVSRHKSYFDVNKAARGWRIFRAWVNV